MGSAVLGHQRFHAQHNIGGFNPEYVGQLEDSPERGTLDTPLHQADVGPVQIAVQSEFLLGDPFFLADFTEGISEGPFRPHRGLNVPVVLCGRRLFGQQNNAAM